MKTLRNESFKTKSDRRGNELPLRKPHALLSHYPVKSRKQTLPYI